MTGVQTCVFRSAKAEGRFGKQDFVYKSEENAYLCPAGEMLPYRFTNVQDGKTMHRYWTHACKDCRLKSLCTPSTERRIYRWEHEAVLETVQARLDHNPEAMTMRRSTVEHPFGTTPTQPARAFTRISSTASSTQNCNS